MIYTHTETTEVMTAHEFLIALMDATHCSLPVASPPGLIGGDCNHLITPSTYSTYTCNNNHNKHLGGHFSLLYRLVPDTSQGQVPGQQQLASLGTRDRQTTGASASLSSMFFFFYLVAFRFR